MPGVVEVAAINLLLGAGFGAAAWTVGPVLAYGAIGAATLGASYAAQSLMRTQIDDPSMGPIGNLGGINAPEVRGSIKQDIPPHRIWFDEARGGGVFYFYRVIPPYLYVGLIHSVLPITAVKRTFIAEQEIFFSGITHNQIAAPIGVAGQPNFPGRIEACFQFGTLDQGTNPLIARDFPGLDRRLPGIANSVWRFHYGANFEEFETLYGRQNIPDVQIVALGCPVPDPSNPVHRLDFDPRDIDDLYDAIGTWDHTGNAALIQAFWAAMPFGLNAGPGAVYLKPRAREILIASAHFDDESVPLKDGGVQKRHTVSGIVTLDDKPLSIMEAMLTANGGFVSPRAGHCFVQSSQPVEPSFTITDADIIGGFRYRDAKPTRDRVNSPRVRFISPENNYQDAETSWPSADEIAEAVADDGEVLEQTLRLGLVLTHQRAQRRLKSFVLETNLGKTLAVMCGLRLLGVTEGAVGLVSLSSYPAANGLYSVESWQLMDDLSGVAFSLVEYDPSIPRDWIASQDEQPFVPEEEEA